MSAPADPVLRPAISAAWHRAERAGLRHETALRPDRDVEYDHESRLVLASRPVLDQLTADLADTRFALVLADRDAHIVDHRVSAHPLRDRLAEVGLTTGTVWDEESTGTNAVATVFQVRRGLSVVGDEHYLDDLKQFCCYGEPLFDPTSGRLEGVLDITGPVADATALLGPFLARARHEIEQRLLDTSRAAHRSLLQAYEQVTAGAGHPVVALGEDMMLANQAATELLSQGDLAVLRTLVARGTQGATSVRLTTGVPARIECLPVTAGTAVLQVRQGVAEVRGSGLARPVQPARQAAPRAGSILVCGEPGTGRSTHAATLAGAGARTFAATRPDQGPTGGGTGTATEDPGWPAELRAALAAGQDVVVEDVHMLAPAEVATLRSLVAAHRGSRIVATCAPVADLGPEHAALAALFDEHRPVPALRQDRGRIPRLVTAMLADRTGPTGPRASAALLDHLARLPWPGNLPELHKVVAHLASAGRPEVGVDDLPERYRQAPPQRSFTPLERSEYDTIIAALHDCRGNKLQAARRLGISRGTLYARMRQFKIPA